jgi:hypothetical protein
MLTPGDEKGWGGVNRSPFLFAHGLARHPLFDLSRLRRLSRLAIEQDQGLGPAQPVDKAQRIREMEGQMADLAHGKHWLKVSAADRIDPEYAELLQRLLAEIEDLSGMSIRSRMTWCGLDVFMNSPNLQVPYHFDHDCNFLMQISGEKDDNLFDPDDRNVLSEAEIEDYYRGNKIAGRFRESIMTAAKCHHLSPGVGVHHPPLAPHLIRNGNEVSVSVAAYFVLPEHERVARVYQSNHFIRKLGMRPRPPGLSRWSDSVKIGLINAVSMSNPTTYDQRLYSGVNRIAAPAKFAKRLTGMLKDR